MGLVTAVLEHVSVPTESSVGDTSECVEHLGESEWEVNDAGSNLQETSVAIPVMISFRRWVLRALWCSVTQHS